MNATITFRTTGDQREHLKAEAKAHEVSVSQILRDALARGLEAASRERVPASVDPAHHAAAEITDG